jgi:transcription initiation factor TFIID subunit 12
MGSQGQASGQPGPNNSLGFVSESQVLDKKRLCELVNEVDPGEKLDEDVEDVLLQIADDFIEHTVSQACALAKHRKAANIDVRDVQVIFKYTKYKKYN